MLSFRRQMPRRRAAQAIPDINLTEFFQFNYVIDEGRHSNLAETAANFRAID
ncbi:hypothetical protein D8O27_22935 [Burkholderia mallei]|uniref:Uncharacterized protein n=5 Tax=pseudomallei group TaxID=111527 RepID=A0AAX1XAH0_BURML|nr:hypothetical protein BMAA0095 [Burkholderia mallei ATCC 23344]AUL58876.1 hypothetical protein BHT10_23560 [Burkholderia pseudomallei]PNX05528.1 hypothetical protein CF649_05905 [Burkholderia sp. 136(2017)]PNX17908.1 hypothetical protein CF650_00590 [Burkholderia sp. 129]PNX32433.1 hypothetical protein CF647_05810 [Burkholderia sp. 117]PNX41387.1 hypothetical protein CF648_05900 [Burkholderia sp. 137]RKN93917.1 hypothetical protein D8O03_26265 [Burkholderia mallei]